GGGGGAGRRAVELAGDSEGQAADGAGRDLHPFDLAGGGGAASRAGFIVGAAPIRSGRAQDGTRQDALGADHGAAAPLGGCDRGRSGHSGRLAPTSPVTTTFGRR